MKFYDFRNDPLPQHDRWKTKPARVVLFLSQLRGGATGSWQGLVGVMVAWIAHYYVSPKAAAIAGLSVALILALALVTTQKYYGFRIRSEKLGIVQLLGITIVAILLIFWVKVQDPFINLLNN